MSATTSVGLANLHCKRSAASIAIVLGPRADAHERGLDAMLVDASRNRGIVIAKGSRSLASHTSRPCRTRAACTSSGLQCAGQLIWVVVAPCGHTHVLPVRMRHQCAISVGCEARFPRPPTAPHACRRGPATCCANECVPALDDVYGALRTFCVREEHTEVDRGTLRKLCVGVGRTAFVISKRMHWS